MQRNVRRQDGAAATEFALVAPVLILLFFGIVYFGLYVYRAQVIESATREGARVASVGGDVADVVTAVEAAATGFQAAEITVAAETDTPPSEYCDSRTDDATIVVTASGSRLDFTVPFFGTVSPTFRATATFECEKTR